MPIQFAHPEKVYDFLQNPPTSANIALQTEGESWKQEQIKEAIRNMPISYGFRAIPLGKPLKRTGGQVCKKGENYSVLSWIEPRQEDAFHGLSKPLKLSLAKKGYCFKETSTDCEGYILSNRDREVRAVIFDGMGEDFNNNKLISIGTNGAIERTCRNPGEFMQGISELEILLNTFLGACFKMHKIRQEKAVLYLSSI